MTTKKFDKETFANDVLVFRSEKNLTRHALWEEIGRAGSNDVILRIENRHHKPCIEVALNLCEVMGKKIEDYMR